MSALFYILVPTDWFVQCASSTTICLILLPLTDKRRSRFAKFLYSFATKTPELDGMKKNEVTREGFGCSFPSSCNQFDRHHLF